MNTNRFCTVDTKTLGHILSRPDIYQKPAQVRKGLGRILGEGELVFFVCSIYPTYTVAIRSTLRGGRRSSEAKEDHEPLLLYRPYPVSHANFLR
jgi:hypothetical protein